MSHGPTEQPRVGDLVLLEWLDIQTTMGWQPFAAEESPARCKSVGFVVSQGDGWIVLAGAIGIDSMSAEPVAECNARQSLPWGCVTSWTRLRTRPRKA